MNIPRLFLLLCVLGVSSASALEKWFYYPTNLLVDKNVDTLETLWRRASAAGYTQVLLSDSKFGRLNEMEARYFKNIERVKKLAAELKIEIVPAVFPVGYSNDILGQDVNLIEAMPVKNLPLVVQGGAAHVDDPAAPVLPDFSNLKKWGFHDECVTAEGAALHVDGTKGGNARIFLPLKLAPWRQYHVSVRVKTQDFHGQPEIKVLPEKGGGAALQWDNLGTKATQDWTVTHVVFNTQQFSEATLIFGVWGTKGGTLWWDAPKIEEVAFVDLSEIAHIEGFDADTAEQIQTRAKEYLEQQEADRDAKRRELGVADEMSEIPGITTAMMVALGENKIKTVEDFADCATDELVGWTERKKDKESDAVRYKGFLDGFELSRTDVENMIMAARVHAGWIKAEDLVQASDETEPADGGEDAPVAG